MSFDINNVNLSGNLTKDAELRFLQDGTPVVKFSIAVNRTVKKGDGWESIGMFFDVTKIGGGIDKMHKELTKGRNVSVSGHLRQDRWQDDQGQPKSKVYIWAEKLVLGRTPRNHGDTAPASNAYDPSDLSGDALKAYQEAHMDAKADQFDDDMPF